MICKMGSFLKIAALFLCLCVHVCCLAGGQGGKLVVLFTADLHSRLLPGSDGRGGVARMATIIERQRENAVQEGAAFILLDGGDIAMGSIFHTLFPSEAIEYRAMARMGYDAFTFGNHDFDFGLEALEEMFRSAHSKDSIIAFPALLSSNFRPLLDTHNPVYFDWNSNIGDCLLLERNGVKVGLFGIMGENSFDVIGRDKGRLSFTDPALAAQKAAAKLRQMGADYIIAISHGGTLNGDDISLARKIKGVDLIISAHDHHLLEEPIYVAGIPIVAAGAFGEYVGKIVFDSGRLESYSLLEVGPGTREEPAMAAWVDSMYTVVKENFRTSAGTDPDDTLAILPAEAPKQVAHNGTMPLGSTIAASYADAARKALGKDAPEEVIGIVPYGMVRKGLQAGAVTARDAYEVLSLGGNEGGLTGYPLVYAWLTGGEIRDLCEMSESIAPYLEDTRLFFSGVEYSTRWLRIPFFKVGNVTVNGKEAEPEKLYMVVTGEYTARMIGLLEKESYGILSAQPKDRHGNPLLPDSFPQLRTPQGEQVPEWKAFADYLRSLCGSF